jgi:Cdc6-like AAA superfamily ATPase
MEIREPATQGPMVGRDSELEQLRELRARATADRRAHLVVIYGEPGVGKSRRVAEFLESTHDATRACAHRTLPAVR